MVAELVGKRWLNLEDLNLRRKPSESAVRDLWSKHRVGQIAGIVDLRTADRKHPQAIAPSRIVDLSDEAHIRYRHGPGFAFGSPVIGAHLRFERGIRENQAQTEGNIGAGQRGDRRRVQFNAPAASIGQPVAAPPIDSFTGLTSAKPNALPPCDRSHQQCTYDGRNDDLSEMSLHCLVPPIVLGTSALLRIACPLAAANGHQSCRNPQGLTS